MNAPFICDIETVPLQSSLALPYDEASYPPPGTMSKPDTIKAWRVAHQAAWSVDRIKKYSLSPRYGRVLCLGLSLPCSDGPVESTHLAHTDDNEAAVLTTFWDVAASHRGQLVTFNGTFDLDFLVTRSLILNVQPTVPADIVRSWFARYRVAPHFDCYKVLTHWEHGASGTLSEWAAVFGCDEQDATTGADIYGLYEAKDWPAIAAHCRADVRKTKALYDRIRGMYAESAA